MFYVALLLLILLGVVALVMVIQNISALLFNGIHLTLIVWHLPGIPVILLCVLALCMGGLLLYVVSSFAARHDDQIIKSLRSRIEELEQAEQKLSSELQLRPTFAPPVVPIPRFTPPNSSVSRQPQGRMSQNIAPSAPPMLAPNGPFSNQQQPPARITQNLPPIPAPNGRFPIPQQPTRITQNLAPAAPIQMNGSPFASPQQPPTGPAQNRPAPSYPTSTVGLFANPQWSQVDQKPPAPSHNY